MRNSSAWPSKRSTHSSRCCMRPVCSLHSAGATQSSGRHLDLSWMAFSNTCPTRSGQWHISKQCSSVGCRGLRLRLKSRTSISSCQLAVLHREHSTPQSMSALVSAKGSTCLHRRLVKDL
jgi:hypothetical protein